MDVSPNAQTLDNLTRATATEEVSSEKCRFHMFMPRTLRRRLRLEAADREIDQQDIVVEALEQYFNTRAA